MLEDFKCELGKPLMEGYRGPLGQKAAKSP